MKKRYSHVRLAARRAGGECVRWFSRVTFARAATTRAGRCAHEDQEGEAQLHIRHFAGSPQETQGLRCSRFSDCANAAGALTVSHLKRNREASKRFRKRKAVQRERKAKARKAA